MENGAARHPGTYVTAEAVFPMIRGTALNAGIRGTREESHALHATSSTRTCWDMKTELSGTSCNAAGPVVRYRSGGEPFGADSTIRAT
jgi:hypothetical protein